MKKNVGKIDRIIRLVLGIALVAYAVMSGNLLGYIGIIPIATALFGWCPLYVPFGLNSCGKDECK